MENKLIHHFLENSAARFPDKVAVIHEDKRATYGEINAAAENLETFLIGRGLAKGDRVVILMENSCEYVIAYYGILKAGAVAVPLSTGLKPDGLNPLLAELEPAALISSQRFERLLQASHLDVPTLSTLILNEPGLNWASHRIDVYSFQQATNHKPTTNQTNKNWIKNSGVRSQEPGAQGRKPKNTNEPIQPTNQTNPQVMPNDLGSIIYTSGSTGTPKGAMLSHANLVANTLAICEYQRLSEKDIHMVVLPFFYVMGKSLLNTHMAAGATIVLNNRFAYPATVLKQMVEEKVTGFSGVPSTYAFLLHRSPLNEYRDKLTNLRFCAQAGGHMARALKRKLKKTLPDHTQIFIMYGATEGGARFTYLDPDRFDDKIDSIGKPIANVRIAILDQNDREVKTGQIGELNASGPNVMAGYWKDSADSAKVLGPHGYRTGDTGYVDEDGFLFLTGRKDDLIKVGGHRISIQEVEDLLLETDLFVEAAVFSIEDDLLGNQLRALVVYKDKSPRVGQVLKACSRIMPKHKIPSEFKKIRALPKNANGKIDRLICRKMVDRVPA